MNESQMNLLDEAKAFVSEFFQNKVDPHFVFHNLDHTQQVVTATEEIADFYNIHEEDRFVLLISAWFHDVGFESGKAEEHEKESASIAARFLEERNVTQDVVQRISSCILATKMPQSPLSQVEKILCDADLFHLGSLEFNKMNMRLKQEREFYSGKTIPNKEWRQRNIEFLESHQYFTDYAQQKQEPRKQVWLKKLRKKQKDRNVEHTEEMEVSPYTFEKEVNKGDERRQFDMKKANKDAERGIQTIFRTTSNNHVRLSEMADSKANIMIQVNSLVITIVLAVLLGRLEYYPHLMLPTLILLLVCITAMVFSILATRPKVNTGTFTEDDIRNKRTNLLFFGNFHKMELEKYNWGMNEMLKDREYIYGSMIKDIYYLGIVLAQKYRYLRISYTIFMYGLIIAVIAFAVAAYTTS